MRLSPSSLLLIVVAASLLGTPLHAQRLGAEIDSMYKAAGDVWYPIAFRNDLSCDSPEPTIYDADIFELYGDDGKTPSGEIGMMTQGNCFNQCEPLGSGDSLFSFRRDTAGEWHFPEAAALAEPLAVTDVLPDSDVCDFTGSGRVNALSTFAGMMGGPAVVSLEGRYYMAFLKGNGDAWSGEIWWASSDDGLNWDVMKEPMLYGKYHRGHQATGTCPEGFTSVSMTTVHKNGRYYFYIYGTYFHPGREYLQGAGRRTASSLLFKIPFRSSSPNGLAPRWWIYYHDAFQRTDGKLVWSYDHQAPRDERLEVRHTSSGWGTDSLPFTQSVTRLDDGTFVMMVGAFGVVYPESALYYRVSDDGVKWDETVYEMDVTAVQWAFSRRGKILVNSEIWHGTLSGQAGTWLFSSWSNRCRDTFYDGTVIIPAKVRFR